MSGPGRRGGFTLLEILIAVGIVGAALMAVASAIDACAVRVLEARRILAAARLARAKLDTVMLARRVDEEAGSGTFEGHPGLAWRVEIAEEPFRLGTLELAPETRRVTVVLEWEGLGRRLELVARRPAELKDGVAPR